MLGSLRCRANLVRRYLAPSAAVLIFALGVFATSPALHAWLHGNDALAADDSCAVVLFAGGVAVSLVAIVLIPLTRVWREAVQPVTREIFPPQSHYLRQPERGPPVRWIS